MPYLRRIHLDVLLRRIPWPHRNVLGFGFVLALLLGMILAVPLSRTSGIKPGEPSPLTIQAPASLTFESKVETDAAKLTAERNVAPAYRSDPNIPDQQRKALKSAFDAIEQIRDNSTLGRDRQIHDLTALPTPPISQTLATTLLQFSHDQWQAVRQTALTLYDAILFRHNYALTDDDVAQVRKQVLPTMPELAGMTGDQRQATIYFVSFFLKANSTVDTARTEERRAEAAASVAPVTVTVARGENIVRRGDIVTDLDYEKLSQFRLVRGVGGWITTAQMLLLGALTAWLFTTYMYYCQETIWQNDRALLVIAGLLATALLAGRLLLPNWDAPYVFPLATMSVLLTVLFNGQLALIATLALAPLLGLQHTSSVGPVSGVGLAVTLALGAAAGIFTAQRARRTSQFAWVALAVTVVTALAALVFWLGPDHDLDTIMQILLLSVVNGALSGVLAVGAYHFLGRLADVVTPLELMELSHPNQPLLRRLMHEAPGTYHHSMVVSNLAEVAAEDIGADPLLARVGAYYHDVGKLLRPYFFTDNQHDRSNVHDVLDAKTSASVIIDHVREGEKLARANGLPQRVVDFIPQHHGTNLVSFFYQRALQEDEDTDIDYFRYPGPKPQTREAAILMLADGIEAAVRAKAQAGKLRPARPDENGEMGSGQTIREIVEQIVDERIAADQLDEAPLTLRDISVIKDSFTKTLQGIYHPRVEYPQKRARVTSEPEIVTTP
jgi:putative nucleotidyltransferase with HDIG domain